MNLGYSQELNRRRTPGEGEGSHRSFIEIVRQVDFELTFYYQISNADYEPRKKYPRTTPQFRPAPLPLFLHLTITNMTRYIVKDYAIITNTSMTENIINRRSKAELEPNPPQSDRMFSHHSALPPQSQTLICIPPTPQRPLPKNIILRPPYLQHPLLIQNFQ